MSDTDQEPKPPTQQTQPQGINPKTGKPCKGIEIPVPCRGRFREARPQGNEGPRPLTERPGRLGTGKLADDQAHRRYEDVAGPIREVSDAYPDTHRVFSRGRSDQLLNG